MVHVSISQLIRHAEQLLPADVQPFVTTCVEALDDPAPKGAFADWLDEHDEPDLAWALRWMARHGKAPTLFDERSETFVLGGTRANVGEDASLPEYMLGANSTWRGSWLKCVLSVAERLAWLREQLDNSIQPPGAKTKEKADAA